MDNESVVNSVSTDGGESTPQADSAPAEQTAPSVPATSEKTLKPREDNSELGQDEGEGEGEGEGGKDGGQSVPYERFKEVNDQLKELKAQMEQVSSKAEVADRIRSAIDGGDQQQVNPRLQKANETLRQLGYMTQDDVEGLIKRERLVSEWKQQMNSLEEKYDGSDGGVKFDRDAVAKYMEENSIYDPETAFKVMNLDAIVDQKAKDKRQTAYSDKKGAPVRAMGNDYSALLEEAKKTGDFTKVLNAKMPWSRFKSS